MVTPFMAPMATVERGGEAVRLAVVLGNCVGL